MSHKIWGKVVGILEQKRVTSWAFLGALFTTLSFCTLWNLQSSRGFTMKMLPVIETREKVTSNSHQTGQISQWKINPPPLASICNVSGEKSDYCEIKGDIRIHGNASSIFFTSPQMEQIQENSTIGIKIYARKKDSYLMGKRMKEQKLKPASTEQEMPTCTVNYTIPAVVFNGGGYAGNLFHAITDVMIPLYLTSVEFNGEVQFLIEDKHSWWIQKFGVFLKAFSNYEFIDLNRDNEIRCFKNAVVGLKAHGEFAIDPKKPPEGYTLRNFTQFIRTAFSLERNTAIKLNPNQAYRRPRLLIIARRQTRVFVNEDELAAEAQGLGFDVDIIDAGTSHIKEFSKTVNSFDVMVGVHGAGLTNMVFLPENAVLIQVTPLAIDGLARTYFEHAARNMNLKYLEYKIAKNESSLLEQYPVDHPVFVDPGLYKKQGWLKFKSIYLTSQNVRVDVSRFRSVLLEALEHLRQ